jgi:flagellar basal body-associated protein FliL
LAVLGFIFAVVGAVTVAWSGAVEASAQAESGAEKAPA